MTHTRTHVLITFANPHLVCDQCKQPVPAWHNPDRCGCEGSTFSLPCEHRAGVASLCASWSPVDCCRCQEGHGDLRTLGPCELCLLGRCDQCNGYASALDEATRTQVETVRCGHEHRRTEEPA